MTKHEDYEQALEEENKEDDQEEYEQALEEKEKKREKKEKMQTEHQQAVEKWKRATIEHALHLERCAARLAAYNARRAWA